MELWHLLHDALILLAGAAIFGIVLERLGQSALLGYLLAGMVVGPGALGLVTDIEAIEGLAELGVALLLFSIGLEFSIRRLLALGKVALLGGALQVGLTALLIAGIALGFGAEVKTALAIGVVAAPSSTAFVLRLLRDRGEMDSTHGRNALGILLFQDAAVVPLVLIVSTLGESGESQSSPLVRTAISIGATVLFIGVFYLLSNYVIPKLFNMSTAIKNREIFVLIAIITCIGAAFGAHELKLSPALGAFIAGVLLAESPFATQVRSEVGGIRTIFLTLFFTSVGMLADFEFLKSHYVITLLATAGMLLIKFTIIYALMRFLKMMHSTGLATGLSLAQMGEFGFVLAGIAITGNLFNDYIADLLVWVTLASLLVTPVLVVFAGKAALKTNRLSGIVKIHKDAIPTAEEEGHAPKDHVVVVGYGPAAQEVVNVLQEKGDAVAVVELNPKSVEIARARGVYALVGDASQAEVLEHLGIRQAKAAVVTIPDHRIAGEIIRQIRCEVPTLPVLARVRLSRYKDVLIDAGATIAVDEEQQIGTELSERLYSEVMAEQATDA